MILERKYNATRSQIIENVQIESLQLPAPDTTITFATQLSTWDLILPNQLKIFDFNDQIYNVTVTIYEKLRKKYPYMNSTSLNHKFFRYQMRYLANTTSDFRSVNVWKGFQSILYLKDLIVLLRRAVVSYLDSHGMSKEQALRKACHPLVVWASVHTAQSIHQPHVTEDALVGGVYYVRVPPNAGRLELYDPRGKSPLRDLNDPMSPPSPPFHRVVGVQPVEGKLVLFPGWLVHSVLQSSSVQTKEDKVEHCDSQKLYRVSLSLNLKGEWQDTASLHLKL
mmetsp:Transcript_33302/g.48215  ORF Transcript_33302/g.48215 Transcript_33302/m.48215 type:complete len:280 (+) Transcript_33302:476-1315(+)